MYEEVKFFLCLINNRSVRAGAGVEVWLNGFLIQALDGGDWPASTPKCFTLEKENPVPIREEAVWVAQPAG